jgi:opacity protein-like surface antigen
MKKQICLLLGILFFTFSLKAQEEGKNSKFSVDFKTGYTFAVAKSGIGSPLETIGQNIVEIEGEKTSITNPYNTRGAGYTLSGSFGYEITENFGVELEFSFLRSSKILNASQDVVTSSGLVFQAEHNSHTIMLRATPLLVVSANKDLKFRPYAKFGLLIPFYGKIVSNISYNDQLGIIAEDLLPSLNPDLVENVIENENIDISYSDIESEANLKANTNGTFSIGFASRLGVAYKVSKNISLIGEMEMNMLTIKSKKTEVKEFQSSSSINGVEAASYTVDDLPEIIRQTNYINEITEMSNSSYNDTSLPGYQRDSPKEQLNFRNNFNSFGFTFGVRYSF